MGSMTQDPVLIISQIVALQCLWYLSLCCLLWLLLGMPMLSLFHLVRAVFALCDVCAVGGGGGGGRRRTHVFPRLRMTA